MIDISEKHILDLYSDYGGYYSKQAVICIEEMSELAKELCKVFRSFDIEGSHLKERPADPNCDGCDNYYLIDPENINEITEEMAHVYICLAALRNLMHISDSDIQKYISAKEKQ